MSSLQKGGRPAPTPSMPIYGIDGGMNVNGTRGEEEGQVTGEVPIGWKQQGESSMAARIQG